MTLVNDYKIDLVGREQIRPLFEPYERAGYTVHYTSVVTGEGMEEWLQWLRARVGAGIT